MGVPPGQPDGEGRADSERALDADGAAVQSGELVDERKSDAAPFMTSRRDVTNPVEALEQVRQLVWGYTDAAVSHLQEDVAAVGAQRDGDFAGQREFERVREEVEHDLLPRFAVHPDRFGERRAFHDEAQSSRLDRRAERAGEIGRDRSEVRRLEQRVDPPRFGAREVEQRVYQLQQPKSVSPNQLELIPLLDARGRRGE